MIFIDDVDAAAYWRFIHVFVATKAANELSQNRDKRQLSHVTGQIKMKTTRCLILSIANDTYEFINDNV